MPTTAQSRHKHESWRLVQGHYLGGVQLLDYGRLPMCSEKRKTCVRGWVVEQKCHAHIRKMSGCWYSFVRCVSNRTDEPRRAHYSTSQIETIKFENLLTLEEQEKASRVPVLTETELQHVREGRLDKLVEDQMILDRERDEKLRQEEEQLRQEEEAYYAAKKEAGKKTKRGLTTITSQPLPTSKVLGNYL